MVEAEAEVEVRVGVRDRVRVRARAQYDTFRISIGESNAPNPTHGTLTLDRGRVPVLAAARTANHVVNPRVAIISHVRDECGVVVQVEDGFVVRGARRPRPLKIHLDAAHLVEPRHVPGGGETSG